MGWSSLDGYAEDFGLAYSNMDNVVEKRALADENIPPLIEDKELAMRTFFEILARGQALYPEEDRKGIARVCRKIPLKDS